MNLPYPEHVIRCPWCGAAPGSRCTTRMGKPLSIASHDARREAYAVAAPTGAPAIRVVT